MTRDNVTPFRRPAPPKQKPPANARDPRTLTKAVYLLAMVSFLVSGFGVGGGLGGILWIVGFGLAVVAVMIAASNRDDGPSWARSHFEFGLRTVVIGAAAIMLLNVFSWMTGQMTIILMPIIWGAHVALTLWVLVRCLYGLYRALRVQPYPRPATWLL